MRVVFVQTYPVYHDGHSTEEWLSLENRDRWMPGIAASMGHEVELWAAGDDALEATSQLEGFGDYPVRLFRTERNRRPTKFHGSASMVEHARGNPADIYVLKGVDGAVGEELLARHVIPEKRRFAFVIGGKFYTRRVPMAEAVFFETAAQRRELAGSRRPWRRRVEDSRLIRLPKSVDTDVFRPKDNVEPEWDVISVGRVDRRLKSFDNLARLSERFRVAVVGSGPSLDELKPRYPAIEWVGRRPHSELPPLLRKSRLFLFEGGRDYFPRVIAEAAACGLPVVAPHSIAPDVLSTSIGMRVSSKDLASAVEGLLSDEPGLREMGIAARIHALENWGKRSSGEALQTMFDLLDNESRIAGRAADGRSA